MVETLETKRLILRPWRESDLEDFHEYCKDPEVGPNAGWKPHETMEESKKILDSFVNCDKAKDTELALVLKENGKVIGSVGILADRLQHEDMGKGKEIGYVLSHAYWGHGLMPEAVKEIIRFLFEEKKLDYIAVSHFIFNARSKRVIEKCGFRYEKALTGVYTNYKGEKLDEVCYLLTRKDYFSGV